MDLEAIFRAHQKGVFVYFLRTVGSRATAEDLTQQTLLRAWESIVGFRGDSSFRTWLTTIARRVLADHYRGAVPEDLVEGPEAAAAQDHDARLDIEAALDSLPLGLKEAIVLCDVLGFEPSDAAAVVGSTPNAFRVRLHRARACFREVYQA